MPVWQQASCHPRTLRERQEDPCGPVAHQCSLTDDFQADERPCLNVGGRRSRGWHLRLSSCTHEHTHGRAYTNTHIALSKRYRIGKHLQRHFAFFFHGSAVLGMKSVAQFLEYFQWDQLVCRTWFLLCFNSYSYITEHSLISPVFFLHDLETFRI